MVTLNTTKYRDVPTGRTSYRRSFFGKFILTVEMQEQMNTATPPCSPPPHYTSQQKASWHVEQEAEYERAWRPVRNYYRDAVQEDMEEPLLKKGFRT